MAAHDDIDDRVYKAVVAGKSFEEVRLLIEEVAQGDDGRRVAAVNKAGMKQEESGEEEETPLQAADRLEEGGLVGCLVIAGADVKKLYDGEATALAMCCKYGQVDCVRALLQAGHDANERMVEFFEEDEDFRHSGLTAAHVCAFFTPASSDPAHQLECLRVICQEGGADINARDDEDYTPLHRLAGRCIVVDAPSAVDAFAALGADLEARDSRGETPLFTSVEWGDLMMLSELLAAGALAKPRDGLGRTPLMLAARNQRQDVASGCAIVDELLRRSPEETRRAVDDHGWSAIDWLVSAHWTTANNTYGPFDAWTLRLAAELLRSGAPVRPAHMAALLRSAARRGAELAAELAARRSDSRRWRAHDCFVPLAFDHLELREAEEGVRRREAKLSEVEQEMRELGVEEEEEQQHEAPPRPSPRAAPRSSSAAAAAAAAPVGRVSQVARPPG